MDDKSKFLSEKDTDEHVDTQAALVFPKAALDADADVAALGAAGEIVQGDYHDARGESNTLTLAAETGVSTKNTEKTNTIKAYNALAKKADEKYPTDTTHKEALGLEMGKHRAAKGQCTKIEDGKAKQWIHNGFAILDWKSLLELAMYYVIEECTGDVTVEANWYAADKPTSTGAEAIVKPKTLNVPTWWRVTGWNAAGEGVAPSDPFGGDPIH
jgi:hypothetical protein